MKVTPSHWNNNPLQDLFSNDHVGFQEFADLRLGVFVDIGNRKKPNFAKLVPFASGDNFGMEHTLRESIAVFHGMYLKYMKPVLTGIQTIFDYLDHFSPEEQQEIIVGIKEMSDEDFDYQSKGVVCMENLLDPDWRDALKEAISEMVAEAKKAKGGFVL
jgi:hypothetical protein